MDGVLVADKEAVALPALRADLEIVPGAPLSNGAPAWVIFDPAANRYFEVGRELLDILTLWSAGTIDQLIVRTRTEFDRVITEEEVGAAIYFLIANALIRDIPNNDYKTLVDKQKAEKRNIFSRAMHSYLFFKIPLLRPDRFLRATWPFVWPLFTPAAVLMIAILGLFGLYMVSRQWDHFTGTFQYMLSWQGLALYGLSLVAVKSLHELGHAYMAVKYGLRVPTIGIAFMVLFPVLYTDTSGAWRLRSRRQRLMIDGAGIFTELSLACLATFLWVFLPDGGMRLCVFAIATTSWITSLFINLNPLMRFDGYYILSDALGFQNMQSRGFEMARWRLRELLFGLGEKPPEPLTVRMRRTVIIHAWATWTYRFFLFLGIALLVYTFFIKIVGILLFAVEILWFILFPVAREMKKWWDMKDKIMRTKRTLVTGGILASLAVASIIPWSTRISIPSIMTAELEQQIFAPFPARITSLNLIGGQQVQKGDVLVRMDAPLLLRDLKLAKERSALLEARIDRIASDNQDRAALIVLTNELFSVREEILGLNRVRERLTILAPFDGHVADVDSELHEGLWVNPKSPLALVQANGAPAVKGYVAETNVFRFDKGAPATFIPDNPDLPIVPVKVREVSFASADQLDEPYLALQFGGEIATAEDKEKPLKPASAQYAVRLATIPGDNIALPQKAVRGVSIISGEAESFYTRAKRQVLKVFVRELGV